MPPARSSAVSREEFTDVAGTLRQHLSECGVENQKTQTSLTTLATSVNGLQDLVTSGKKLLFRTFTGLVGIIVTAAITLLIQNWNLKQTTATKADLAVRTSSRYTQADAQQDRAAQEARFQAIVSEIRKKK